MTDEEKAEKYADWFWGASPSERRAIKQAYLDGLAEVRKENEDLKKQIEQMKRSSNCKNFNRDFELCFFSGGDEDYHCRNRRWELVE